MVSASVGIILRLIDAAAERAGPVGAAILYALNLILGLTWSVVTVFGMLAFVVLLTAIGTGGEMWLLIGGAIFYFVVVGVAFNLAGTIFTTALFVDADTGELPGGFDEDPISNAIGSRF